MFFNKQKITHFSLNKKLIAKAMIYFALNNHLIFILSVHTLYCNAFFRHKPQNGRLPNTLQTFWQATPKSIALTDTHLTVDLLQISLFL